MFTGPIGFGNAPLSKLAWVVVLAASLGVMITEGAEMLWFAPERVAAAPHELLWRIPASAAFLRTPLELILALLLVYQWRMFERQMGTAKTCVLVAFAWLVHVLACIATLALPPHVAAALSPVYGPYWAVTAFAVLYVRDVPATAHFRLFGALRLSNKWLTYTLVVQAVIAGIPGSLVGAVAGLLAGLLYRSQALGLGEYRPPRWLSSCCAAVFLPILEPQRQQQQQPQPQIILGPGRRLDGAPAFGAAAVEGALPEDIYAPSDHPQRVSEAPTPPPPTAVPAEAMPAATPAPAAVSALVAMGFEERAAREALSRCGGTNVEAAAALLLDSHL